MYTNKILSYIFISVSFFAGCSNSNMYNTPNGQGISMSLSGLYPSLPGESYALWLEFPKSAVSGKNQVQHGSSSIRKLVSAFRINQNGSMTGLDTINLAAKLGFPLALANHSTISIEKTDSIGTSSRAAFLGGDITGNATTGTATLKTDNDDGLANDFSGISGVLTLANAPNKPAADLELYLMNATSPTQTTTSLKNLLQLPSPWHYALWAVDSSAPTSFYIYYGTFTSPDGVDSQPLDNHYNYPGGRYPADSTLPCYNLRSGKVTVMVTLEPITDGVHPATPFGAVVLQKTIPASAQGFSPMDLINRTALLPTASIIIHR